MQLKTFRKSWISYKLLAIILFQLLYPSVGYSLTSGPAQPEFSTFQSVGTTDLVDPFTGDFSYNIPLLDVDGYPVNIFYNSNVTNEQEASWTGLGWNINAGNINRAVRGLPDDFNGDEVIKRMNVKDDWTFGIKYNKKGELFGLGKNIGGSVGAFFNSYKGIGFEAGINASVSIAENCKVGGNLSLSYSVNSQEGIAITPNAGISLRLHNTAARQVRGGINGGITYSSRTGLQQFSIGTSLSASNYKVIVGKDKAGKETKTRGDMKSSNTTSLSGSSFNLGTPGYAPQVSLPINNYSFSGNFALGIEVQGATAYPNSFGAYYSTQALQKEIQTTRAYGYLYHDEGVKSEESLLDFNREKDVALNLSIPALPQTNFTYDIFSVYGQGAGGSFRPQRASADYVYDPTATNASGSGDLSVEFAPGSTVKLGIDAGAVVAEGYTKRWDEGNGAKIDIDDRNNSITDEKIYFKDASDKSIIDETVYNDLGKDAVMRYKLDKIGDHDYLMGGSLEGFGGNFINKVKSQKRTKRNQVITYLTQDEVNQGFGLNNKISTYPNPGHHIAEVTYLKTDGQRYFYGLPVYNKLQKEQTFAVGSNVFGGGANGIYDASKGLVNYTTGNNTTKNREGIDHYFEETETPAFAYSYLLTAIVSPEYVDVDNSKGPSDGDLGAYTRFTYKQQNDYKWRVPSAPVSYVATLAEGSKATTEDDKAHIMYGEKELYYLDSIVTKNYVAKFHTSERKDAIGTFDINGAATSGAKQYKLDSISLFSKAEVRSLGALAVPIKRVHFEYDYSLCKALPNNNNTVTTNKGKLTLRKIFFTYSNSDAGAYSPYRFSYGAFNPDYNPQSMDRWGTYKSNDNAVLTPTDTTVAKQPSSEFPYTEQNKTTADMNARAWLLDTLQLPSGGKMIVNYESDDYAFVQNKQATQMYRIVAHSYPSTPTSPVFGTHVDIRNNCYYYFRSPTGATNTNLEQYFQNIEQFYYKYLVQINGDNGGSYEYISGYAKIDRTSLLLTEFPASSGKFYIRFKFEDVKLGNNLATGSGITTTPICKSALRYGKNQLPKIMDNTLMNVGASKPGFGVQFINALVNVIQQNKAVFTGPNRYYYEKLRCSYALVNKSFVRLNNVTGHKYGGGTRVKSISINDNWRAMTSTKERDALYGTAYSYDYLNGTSSGVAAYEPMAGGEENALKYPDFLNEECLRFGDEPYYLDGPYGESFYPAPSVGYSRVTMKNTVPVNAETRGDGSTVYEFYTARDFPTYTSHSGIDRQNSPLPLWKKLLAGLSPVVLTRASAAVSDGFCIETNDMHGKPRSVKKYAANKTDPYSSVTYTYQAIEAAPPNVSNASPRGLSNYTPFNLDLNRATLKLDNSIKTIQADGTVADKTFGIYTDVVADFKHSYFKSWTPTIQFNTDVLFVVLGVVPIPTVWPKYTEDSKDFKSAAITKVIQRFGILKKVEVLDEGSTITTENVAYDAETGNPILTQVQNNYNQPVYNFNFPAHWHYKPMGGAYQNIGYKKENVKMDHGYIRDQSVVTRLAEGDELIFKENVSGNIEKLWVEFADSTEAAITNKYGDLKDAEGTIKVIRSGYRNLLDLNMASMTTLVDPLINFTDNQFAGVLQASAVDYSNLSKIFCYYNPLPNISTNPYVTGKKGQWYVNQDQHFITDRKQTSANNNVDLSTDGTFTSYTPFYQLQAGNWVKSPQNWVSAARVSVQSPFGVALESKDALDRYDAGSYGYTQSLTTTVVKNSKYSEAAYDGFEKGAKQHVTDDRFGFAYPVADATVSEESAHTGYSSLKVNAGRFVTHTSSVKMDACGPLSECELKYKIVQTSTTVKTIYITGGKAPFNISSTIVAGNPTIKSPSLVGAMQITKGSATYNVQVKVIDKTGCSEYFTVTN
jgi:hypothetical protein